MGIEPDIKSLLKPYEDVGTKENPIKLTLESISFELTNRFKYQSDIVGAAIWTTFHKMLHEGLTFPNGRELVLYMKRQCLEITKNKTKEIIKNHLIEKTTCMKLKCPFRSGELKILSRWNRFILFLFKPRGIFWRL